MNPGTTATGKDRKILRTKWVLRRLRELLNKGFAAVAVGGTDSDR